jgi:hypothetical protein
MPTLSIPKEGQQHKDLLKRVSSMIDLAERGRSADLTARWQTAEERTLAAIPETEVDGARRQRRADGVPVYTTIQVPYTFAMLLSAHTYWTSVFLGRTPVHQYAGRHGEAEMQVQALEALIGYQVEVGNALPAYYIWLYDAGKYGVGITGEYWMKEKLHYGSLVEMQDPADPNGTPKLYQTTQEIMGYQGNKIYNIAPYDFWPDPRVSYKNFQSGQFTMVRCRVGWNDILRRKDAGYYNENIQYLNYHTADKEPTQGSSSLLRPDFSFLMWDSQTDSHPAGAVLRELYVDLIPKEWGIGETNFPQKWCFTVTEDRSLIVGASPLGYMHCKFPQNVMESEIEGYGLVGRGIPEMIEPLQNTMDWLLNSHFYNVRASLNNQFIVDPSKLVVKDAAKAGPGFIWRLRPEAYGSDISKIFMQVPVSDVTRAHVNDLQTMLGFGERMLGVNDQIMGALNPQGRKTATEIRTTTGFGVNRMKTTSEWMSCCGFSPHSQKLVQNSQQLYDAQAKLRLVGSLAQEAGPQFINVTPESITGFFDMVPVDGTLPIDRMAQANLWKELMSGLRMMPPQVAMSYDWGRIFGWVATLAGLKNISQFRIQVVPDQMMNQQVQAGNVVPMPQKKGLPPTGASPGNAASTQTGLEALGLTPGEQQPTAY